MNQMVLLNATFCVIKGMNIDIILSVDSQIRVSYGNHQVKSAVLTEVNKCFEWILRVGDSHALNADRYFLILKEYNSTSVNVDLQFNRTDYTPIYSNVSRQVNNCTMSSCTVPVQNIFGHSSALIVVISDLDQPLLCGRKLLP